MTQTDIKTSKAEKRAAALRENLRRRKAATQQDKETPSAMSTAATQPKAAPDTALTTALTSQPGIMPDHWIRERAMQDGMIEPFTEKLKREGVISYGLSSYGYDARLADEFMIFTNVDNAIVDPKDFSNKSFVSRTTDVCVIPPNSFVLCRTVEYFRIPKDVLVICLGKSTYARCGLIVNVTPLEPGWEGHVTLEISNTTPLPAKVYANEGICQFLFFKGSSACETSYADRSGKYMGQRGVTLPKVEQSQDR